MRCLRRAPRPHTYPLSDHRIDLFVTTLNYADRATFSIAGSAAAKELALTPVATGYVLSAFAWAYALAQIGGALLDRFGTKRIYTIAIACWSLLRLR
jgi:ACS family glucarate transporter-like MFS transporter